jgi:dTDP-4-amino-4,6-dideoxygalactose transaminase
LPKPNTVPELRSSKSSEWRVPLSDLTCGEHELTQVTRVLRSGWWTCGPETEELEKEFAVRLGVRHAIAVANGTAALHLAFMALQLSEGDEVITPSLTFVAAANMIVHTGAIPRFAEVAAVEAPLVTAETLERAITPKTRGICVMHYGGYPCAMDSIVELARQHKLWIVEDAAHAPGAVWNKLSCGRWGDIGCFSFFGNKNLTCAEGGLVVTEDDDYAKRLRLLRSHGMDSLTWDRFRGHSFSYDVTIPGFNYRMDDLRAALLRVQLQSLDRWNSLRKERVEWYRRLLGPDSRWTIPFEDHPGTSAYHLMPVVLGEGISRSGIMAFLKSMGIQTSIHYPPVHQFTCYRAFSAHAGLRLTEDLGRRILTLPLYPGMTYQQVKLVCDSFHEAIEDANAGIEKAV